MSENNIWSSFLRNDPRPEYEDRIALYCEELLSRVQLDFQKSNPESTIQNARYYSMALIMKEMLGLQYEHAPDTMQDMTVELFLSLPQMKDFRQKFIKGIQDIALGKSIEDIED